MCRPRSETPQNAAYGHGLYCFLQFRNGISVKHGTNKNEPHTLSVGNRDGPVRKVKIEESTRHKLVNLLLMLGS